MTKAHGGANAVIQMNTKPVTKAHNKIADAADNTDSNVPTKTYPAELRDILDRANHGDQSALPDLKRAFDDNPELVAVFGDLVKHAEQALVKWAAGPSLIAHEAITRHVAELRSRLMGTCKTELEKLLVDRICISHVEAYRADFELAHRLNKEPATSPATPLADKRLGRAHARYLSAIKMLATLQKLMRPSLSTVEMLQRSVSETGVCRGPSAPASRLNAVLAGASG